MKRAFSYLLLLAAIFGPGCSNEDERDDARSLNVDELWLSYDRASNDKLRAKDILLEILAQQPNDPLALNNLAVHYVQDERWADAADYFKKAKANAADHGRSEYLKVIALTNSSGHLAGFYFLSAGDIPDVALVVEENLRTLTK